MMKSILPAQGIAVPLYVGSRRTYKTRLLFHIPINLLEICANLSKH